MASASAPPRRTLDTRATAKRVPVMTYLGYRAVVLQVICGCGPPIDQLIDEWTDRGREWCWSNTGSACSEEVPPTAARETAMAKQAWVARVVGDNMVTPSRFSYWQQFCLR